MGDWHCLAKEHSLYFGRKLRVRKNNKFIESPKRAIYRNADIYLFDDPFSAVDPKVGKKLARSVQTYLKGKTRFVVTHQEHYLPLYNQLVNVQNGSISSILKNSSLPDESIFKEESDPDWGLAAFFISKLFLVHYTVHHQVFCTFKISEIA